MRSSAAARRDRDLISQLDAILELDTKRRALVQKVEALKADRNQASEEVARRKKAGEDAAELLTRLKKLSGEIKQEDQELREIEGKDSYLAMESSRSFLWISKLGRSRCRTSSTSTADIAAWKWAYQPGSPT